MCKVDKICKVWNEEQVKWKGYNDRLDGCPLKPLPTEKKPENPDETWEEMHERWGYNKCVEEILDE